MTSWLKSLLEFYHNHDLIGIREKPEPTCNDNYIRVTKRRTSERIKGHNGRESKSHLVKQVIKKNHEHFEAFNFKVSNNFCSNTKKCKVAEALLISEIKPTSNIIEQSVPLQIFNW